MVALKLSGRFQLDPRHGIFDVVRFLPKHAVDLACDDEARSADTGTDY